MLEISEMLDQCQADGYDQNPTTDFHAVNGSEIWGVTCWMANGTEGLTVLQNGMQRKCDSDGVPVGDWKTA